MPIWPNCCWIKGYKVHGIKRRASQFNTDPIDHLYQDPHDPNWRFVVNHGDMTDAGSRIRMLDVQPDEIYNLAAQSHVVVSFEEPERTAESDGIGTLRLLEAIRILGPRDQTRFYQASTPELYGPAQEIPQRKTAPLHPRSPYAAARLAPSARRRHRPDACLARSQQSTLRGVTTETT